MRVPASSAINDLASDIGGFTHDPLNHARYVYPWGHGALADWTGPKAWQGEVLEHIGQHLRDPKTRHVPCLIAVASGHGIGKSALIGMVSKWAMDTCVDTKVSVTANTEPQLRTKLWPEVSKWFNLAINSDWFNVHGLRIHSAIKKHHEAWRMDAVTWSETNTEAFQGLHNARKRLVVVFDEASGIPGKIWEVTEGALTDAETEIIWLVLGNPTNATGRFRECFRSGRWKTWEIDSRTVEGTNKALFEQWAKEYGEDSDFFKVRVRGMFPSQSVRQLISETDVDAAYGRYLRPEQYQWAPKIIAVDPAWEGDDELCIVLRQGLGAKILHTQRKNDNDIEVANRIARLEDEHKADAVFIDGGYGTGIVSAGRTLGRNWQIVWFSGASLDPGCANKRAEMWVAMRDWLKQGGAIPEDRSLRYELMAPQVIPKLDGKIQLEPKSAMKARGIPSPNRADALALTFAFPVASKATAGVMTAEVETEYDPFR
jgi:hypothetical protein